ncbi:UNVERIFIED_CONTAM: SH3 domain-containing protein 2 [Sesamum latifolium]|uniref:SH3 domain-containing protein 2 n=1 Tax=Sesamum latifolium TaxID=2727402 RepID=A0AAW2VRL2_9LAMI
MEAIRKQATKLREQVAKQQQHFQRDIVRGVEGYIVTGTKQVEIGTKLSEDSRKYGTENTCTTGSTLSKVALGYSRARAQIEKERENLLKLMGTQVAEPIRAMVVGSALEDARHLAQRYDRVRQEAEAQVEAERTYHQRVLEILDQLEGEVIHGYQAESDVELTLAVGDYVVVRKVTNNGWAEGECKGKAGWFPFEYVERRERVLASKVAEVF